MMARGSPEKRKEENEDLTENCIKVLHSLSTTGRTRLISNKEVHKYLTSILFNIKVAELNDEI